MTEKSFQDYYPAIFAHCYGCGRLNEHGHQIKSYWDGDESVAHYLPKPYHISIPGYVYGGLLDKFPLGAAFAKGLTLKMGQTHMHKYMPGLLERIERGEIDPSFIITHRVTLDDAPTMYRVFRDKQDDCIKVVMKPNGTA